MTLQAPWRMGVDVGGTFTDLVLADAAGGVHVTKVPSTPADPATLMDLQNRDSLGRPGMVRRDGERNVFTFA